MGSRLFWRRSATAVGIYSATLLGFLGTLLAARALGPREFGLLAIVIAATGFFQSFLDLTVEEAVIKYGFRYSTAEDWGRLRRLFSRALAFKGIGGVLGALALVALAPLAHWIFGARGWSRRCSSPRSCRSRRRRRASPASRSSCAAATTSAAGSSPSRWRCAASRSGSARATASRRR